jgi:fructose-1,6-bisphosphatase/inositol monophosphatase family enzyme
MTFSASDKEMLRQLLCALQLSTLKAILKERDKHSTAQLTAITETTAADVIYAIDTIADQAIFKWFEENWPDQWPVQIIMEGLDDRHTLCFPLGTTVKDSIVKCIIDPIDGTRGIMYDKRSAWILAGIAPQRGTENTLTDIEVSVMTEIPTSRQWRADQLSAARGHGIHTAAFDIRNNFTTFNIELTPSTASDVRHAFGTISRFFPAGSTLLGQIEELLWDQLYGESSEGTPLVFNDQYISTGGQFYEILSGHDRFIADLRPIAFRVLDIEENLTAHPYDVCTALILKEGGCIVEHPDGSPLDCPLDTTSAVNWVVYANEELASHIRPVLNSVLKRLVP